MSLSIKSHLLNYFPLRKQKVEDKTKWMLLAKEWNQILCALRFLLSLPIDLIDCSYERESTVLMLLATLMILRLAPLRMTLMLLYLAFKVMWKASCFVWKEQSKSKSRLIFRLFKHPDRDISRRRFIKSGKTEMLLGIFIPSYYIIKSY